MKNQRLPPIDPELVVQHTANHAISQLGEIPKGFFGNATRIITIATIQNRMREAAKERQDIARIMGNSILTGK